MKPKLMLFISIVIVSVFSHYFLKHDIISRLNENYRLEEEFLSEKELNKVLTTEYNNLQAYSRIVNKAKSELGMILPATDSDEVIIVQKKVRRNRNIFRLIDYMHPSAVAAE